MKTYFNYRWWYWLYLILTGLASGQSKPFVSPVPDAVRQNFKLDPFYQKYTSVDSLPIVGSTNVTDFALQEAAYIISNMLTGHEAILQALTARHVKVVVMAHNEYTTDLPEQSSVMPKIYWDNRARGLGGKTCSCAEENLLCYPGDPYAAENILIHEFAHVIHSQGLRQLDPSFDKRLNNAYADAVERGLWKNTYAAVDAGEYWAEAVQDWFDSNRSNDALHNHVCTRAQLKEYDPGIAALCAKVFGENPWRYKKPMDRNDAGRAHLNGFDPASAPRFHWREAPVADKPRVQIETSAGIIIMELNRKAAPATVTNFLKYAHERLYNDGSFFRTVTLENQPTNSVKIQVIQACANPNREKEFLPPIPLERTRDTGLRHLDGAVSMARSEPDTAQDHFFICVGDQPELDFGGKRNPDGQGFAVFGRVVEGMDVVRKIHFSPADGQMLTPPVRIQRAIRLE